MIVCNNILTTKKTVKNVYNFTEGRGFKKVGNRRFIWKAEANFTKYQIDSYRFFLKIDFEYTTSLNCARSSKNTPFRILYNWITLYLSMLKYILRSSYTLFLFYFQVTYAILNRRRILDLFFSQYTRD